MEALPDEPIQQFLHVVKPFLEDWRSIDLRIIAIHDSIGYVFSSIRATLDPHQTRKTTTGLPRVDGLLAVHEGWSIDRLPQLLMMLKEGELKVGGEVVQVKRKAGPTEWRPDISMFVRWYDRQSARSEFGIDYTSIVLTGWEGSSQSANRESTYRRLLGALRSSRPPWDGLEDLRRSFVGLKGDRPKRTDSAEVEVIAPIGVRLSSDTKVDKNLLRVGIEVAPYANPQKICLAVVAPRQRGVMRLQWTPKRYRPSSRPCHYNRLIRLPRSYDWVTCMVTYKGVDADRLEALGHRESISIPRMAAFEELAGDIDSLRDLPDGKHFEAHIEILLHLMGFATAHYGGRDWPAGLGTPDVLAFPPEGKWFLVVECTEREPDLSNKMTKLSTRTRELQAAVKGHNAYPVIVTALERALINPTDAEKASKENIALVTKTDIQGFVTAAIAGRTPEEIRSFLEGFIPSGVMGFSSRWPRS